jgi:hypothetical protein
VTDSSVVFSATGSVPGSAGNVPVSGGGRRMMWYPAKSAFRAGYVTATNWDKDSVGNYSIAIGYDTKASGYNSTAAGYNTKASGDFSTAMGTSTTASGLYSSAIGYGTTAGGLYSTALGYNTKSIDTNSLAMGNFTTAGGFSSTAFGFMTATYGRISTAMGSNTIALGNISTAMGVGTMAKASGSLSAGMYNDITDAPNPSFSVPTDRVFQIGNGIDALTRSNALTVLRNGNAGIGTINPLARLHVTDSAVVFSSGSDIPGTPGNPPVSGTGRRMMWYADKAAFRTGYVNSANWDKNDIGNYSSAMGYNTKASGLASMSVGYNTAASGYNSTAMGNFTIARGNFSTATGVNTIAKAYGSFIAGVYNDTTDNPNPTSFVATDRIFQIGNGDFGIRSNAFTILRNGNAGIGTINPLARLHVADSSVVFSAAGDITFPLGNPPLSGAGRRMMWYADEAAFRAGYIDGTHWDLVNIGRYSFASGNNTIASDLSSTAMGFFTTASGTVATALGNATIASGHSATALGHSTIASGLSSTALGIFTTASGERSTAMGDGTVARAYASTTMGVQTKAKAYGSLSIGVNNDSTDNPNPVTAALTDRIFQIGNGDAIANIRSNALTVLRNGNVGIGRTGPDFPLSFSDNLGTKISFYGSTGYHYGLGIQNFLMQIYTADNAGDIAFGYGNTISFSETMRIKGTGNVGIGISSPSQKLHVVGNICATGTIGSCSDIRYKRDFVPINKALSSVLSLNGFYYYWKKDEFPGMQFNDQRQLGFSAQEIEKSYPELVMTDANGYKSVDYGRLTPVLVEAIKEQQKEIGDLKKDNMQMQEQINELKKMMKKITDH